MQQHTRLPTQKLSQRDLRTIIRYLTKSFETRQFTWQQLTYDYGHGYHPDTVKHGLHREGYYKCKACQMTFLTNDNVANRLAFAKAHKQRSFGFWKLL
jgi:transposase-like protein